MFRSLSKAEGKCLKGSASSRGKTLRATSVPFAPSIVPVVPVPPPSVRPSASSGTEILPERSNNMLARTVVVRHSLTRGSAALHPGLFTFNPSGVGFERVPHCGREIVDYTSANFHIFTFPNFHILHPSLSRPRRPLPPSSPSSSFLYVNAIHA